MIPLLAACQLSAGYGAKPVVRGIDLEVYSGEVVALLGANGAGKTTTLRTLSGDLAPSGGEIRIHGRPTRSSLHRRARAGIGLVTEERAVFMGMSVLDNLRVGRCDIPCALELFPELASRLSIPAGLLSGGEQQMLALGRTLARRPAVLLADELSLGLAPLVVQRLLQAIRAAADGGIGVLLVEQHVRKVLAVTDRGYLIERGRIQLSGSSEEIRARLADVEASYLAAVPDSATDGKGPDPFDFEV
jgi:ABC-type branched-subunit amino acid transport system ATPase component